MVSGMRQGEREGDRGRKRKKEGGERRSTRAKLVSRMKQGTGDVRDDVDDDDIHDHDH